MAENEVPHKAGLKGPPEWEKMGEGLWRFPCPGGWVYSLSTGTADAVCFVPDPNHAVTLRPVPHDAGWDPSGVPSDQAAGGTDDDEQ
jgi:hypothetical protein